MAGSLGEVWFDIYVRDRTQEGLASATAGTAKATAEMQKATAAVGKTILKETRTSAKEISQLGMGIAMLGNTLSNAAVQAKLFGINLGGMEPVIGGLGIALGTIGSTMQMTQSLMKAWAVINYGTLIPSITAAVVATYAWVAANAALTMGLSLVVAGLALWYFQSQRNVGAAGRMEKSQKDLETQAHDTKTEIEKLTDKLKDLETVENRLAGIPADIAQADRDHQRAILGVRDAQDEYNEKAKEREKIETALTQVSRIAAETGIPEADVRRQLSAQLIDAKMEEKRATLDLGDAQARETSTQQGYNDALAEQDTLQKKLATKPAVETALLVAETKAAGEATPEYQRFLKAGGGLPTQMPGATKPGGLMATTTITIQSAYFTVANGQTVPQVLEDFAARSQSKNRVQSGVRL